MTITDAITSRAMTVPDTPSRTALVTGANTGIGRITAVELAKAGYTVYLGCRSEQKALAVQQEIAQACGQPQRAPILELDLADLASVRRCAEAFARTGLALDLLVNNAGVAGARGTTRQGFELAFGVNHLGHFLLTQALLPQLRAARCARVVTVASRAHLLVRKPFSWDALERPTRSLTGVYEYGVSKLANILFSAELARRLEGTSVSTYALHPGVVGTEVWRHAPGWARPLLRLRPMLTPEQGARTTLFCCLQADQHRCGRYWSDCAPAQASALANDSALAEQLWQHSERMLERA
jgi:retinol dehydrogenase 12